MMRYSKNAVLLANKNGMLPMLRKQMIVHEIRKHYDADDELAVLRQMNVKTDEYEAYNAYAEECKKSVDAYLPPLSRWKKGILSLVILPGCRRRKNGRGRKIEGMSKVFQTVSFWDGFFAFKREI